MAYTSLCCVLILVAYIFDGINATKPHISPNVPNIKLIENEPQTITCSYTEEVEWIVPEDLRGITTSLLTISENEIYSKNYQRSFTLNHDNLNNLTNFLVGPYYCLSKTLVIKNMDRVTLNELYLEEKVDRIFVYIINATNHHLAGNISKIHEFKVAQNMVVYFPCWPTEPNINIILTRAIFSIPIEYELEPYLGIPFNVTDPNDFTTDKDKKNGNSDFYCRADGDDMEEITTIIYEIKPPKNAKIVAENPSFYAGLNGNLTLNCSAENDKDAIFNWSYQSEKLGSLLQKCKNSHRTLSLTNLSKQDEGTYTCTVNNTNIKTSKGSTSQRIYVTIVETPVIKVIKWTVTPTTRTHDNNYSIPECKLLRMQVLYKAHPVVVSELGNWTYSMTIVDGDSRITNKIGIQSATFEVNNTQLSDSGIYTLFITNHYVEKKHSFNVIVTAAPRTSIAKQVITQSNRNASVECNVVASPPAQISWYFGGCDFNFECTTESILEDISVAIIRHSKYNFTHILNFNVSNPGLVRCEAKNYLGNMSAKLYLMERREHFSVDPPGEFVEGMNNTLVCFASKYEYKSGIRWFLNKTLINEEFVRKLGGVRVIRRDSPFMYQATLEFPNVSKSNEGSYNCEADFKTRNTAKSHDFQVSVQEYEAVTIEGNSSSLVYGQGSLALHCYASGMPSPSMKWYKNGHQLEPNKTARIIINETCLEIKNPNLNDIGKYECRAENKGSQNYLAFNYQDDRGMTSNEINIGEMVISVMISIVLIGILILFGMRWFGVKRVDKPFEQGNMERWNSQLVLTDQADILPYNKQFDFCANNLELGILLGVGAFGEVLKGVAKEIVKDEPTTTVAVKRVKEPVQAQNTKALIAEMKIMIYIGPHMNVIRLLGVVHEKLKSKGELLVITEFCAFGNLHSYILTNRKYFVNQVNPQNDQIDTNVTTLQQQYPEPHAVYANYNQLRASNNDDLAALVSGNSAQNGSRHSRDTHESKAHQLNVNEGRTITTMDLVCWSYQISQGLNFLSSKGVLHGDLAARNILLAANNIVKICDFGLSRKLRPEELYQKESSAPIPLRWMPIESIDSKLFNTSSDIWSFGVMMWELFSLSAVPYSEISNEDLLQRLHNGHRLARPKYSTGTLYQIMMNCWRVTPDDRPRFNALAKSLAGLMSKELAEKYLDTDAMYVVPFGNKQINYRIWKSIAIPTEESNLEVNLNHTLDLPMENMRTNTPSGIDSSICETQF